MAALYFDRQQKDKRFLSAAIKKLELAPLYSNFENKERFDLNAAIANFEINEMTKQLLIQGGGIKRKTSELTTAPNARKTLNLCILMRIAVLSSKKAVVCRFRPGDEVPEPYPERKQSNGVHQR